MVSIISLFSTIQSNRQGIISYTKKSNDFSLIAYIAANDISDLIKVILQKNTSTTIVHAKIIKSLKLA